MQGILNPWGAGTKDCLKGSLLGCTLVQQESHQRRTHRRERRRKNIMPEKDYKPAANIAGASEFVHNAKISAVQFKEQDIAPKKDSQGRIFRYIPELERALPRIQFAHIFNPVVIINIDK